MTWNPNDRRKKGLFRFPGLNQEPNPQDEDPEEDDDTQNPFEDEEGNPDEEMPQPIWIEGKGSNPNTNTKIPSISLMEQMVIDAENQPWKPTIRDCITMREMGIYTEDEWRRLRNRMTRGINPTR